MQEDHPLQHVVQTYLIIASYIHQTNHVEEMRSYILMEVYLRALRIGELVVHM